MTFFLISLMDMDECTLWSTSMISSALSTFEKVSVAYFRCWELVNGSDGTSRSCGSLRCRTDDYAWYGFEIFFQQSLMETIHVDVVAGRPEGGCE